MTRLLRIFVTGSPTRMMRGSGDGMSLLAVVANTLSYGWCRQKDASKLI